MRVRLIGGLILIFWAILIAKIYTLAVKSNDYYEQIAQKNVIKTELIAPVRGNIYDVKGKALAMNRLGFSIFLEPHLKNDELNSDINALNSLLNDINSSELLMKYNKENSPYNQNPIEIIDFIEYETLLPHFAALSLRPNLSVLPASKRLYPNDNIASHVIGYVGRANLQDYKTNPISKLTNYTGRSGIEKYYNAILQGKSGEKKTKVTALNQQIEQISYFAPKSSDIALTIDLDFQRFIYENFTHKAGAVIVMNVKDGSILAALSYPEYNLNPFVTGISHDEWNEIVNSLDHPFTNKLVNGLYPPASTIKMASAFAFLQSGKMDKDDGFVCSGSFELGGRNFRCHRSWGHGFVNLNDAIKMSCDDYFYKASLKVGIEFMSDVYENFGFGAKTSVDLPNEFVGTVPSSVWKMQKYKQPWYQGDTLITAIGQGSFLVTPMQITKYLAMIATGNDVKPHFLHSIDGVKVEQKEKKEIFTPKQKKDLFYIRKAMKDVANSEGGTAQKSLVNAPIHLAAKTGTAQVVGIPQSEIVRMKEVDMEYYKRSHAWLVAYGPYENPKYAVTILIEHGSSGSRAGADLMVKIFDELIKKGYIDKKYAKK